MSDYQQFHMTPNRDGDCHQGFCFGVEGGVCVGMTDPSTNGTLWWCCKPYDATCAGGSQLQCERDSAGTLSTTQIACSRGSNAWCCSNTRELCAPETGLDGTCIPRDFPNPAVNGPVWGPNAVTSSTSTSASGSETTSAIPTPLPTESEGLSVGGAAGVGAGGVLVLVLIGGGLFYLWRRRAAKKLGSPEHPAEMGTEFQPQEMQGFHLHELETEFQGGDRGQVEGQLGGEVGEDQRGSHDQVK